MLKWLLGIYGDNTEKEHLQKCPYGLSLTSFDSLKYQMILNTQEFILAGHYLKAARIKVGNSIVVILQKIMIARLKFKQNLQEVMN